MNKKAAQTILCKVSKNCNIPKKSLILTEQSKTIYELQIGKNLQEEEWLCLEEIISEHNLRLKLVDTLIIIF